MSGARPDLRSVTARPGLHVVEVTDDFLQQMAEQANPGYRVTLTWGEPDAEGIFTPTITVHNWSQLHSEALVRLAEAERLLVRWDRWASGFGKGLPGEWRGLRVDTGRLLADAPGGGTPPDDMTGGMDDNGAPVVWQPSAAPDAAAEEEA